MSESSEFWDRRNLINRRGESGDSLSLDGERTRALQAYESAFEAMNSMAARETGNLQWEAGALYIASKIGELREVRGDSVRAPQIHKRTFATLKRQPSPDPIASSSTMGRVIASSTTGHYRRALGSQAGPLRANEELIPLLRTTAATDAESPRGRNLLYFLQYAVPVLLSSQEAAGGLRLNDPQLTVLQSLGFEEPFPADRVPYRHSGEVARIEINDAGDVAFRKTAGMEILNGPGLGVLGDFAERLSTHTPYLGGQSGRGIVTCAGGMKYFPSGWVLVRRLRDLGCKLPIEWWYLGRDEMAPRMIRLLEAYGVRCVNAYEVARREVGSRLCGWSLKLFAIAHSAFEEVLFLDADNVPAHDPTFLFHERLYQETGVLLWPDRWRGRAMGSHFKTLRNAAYEHLGLPSLDEPETESGQLMIHKERAWRAINLALSLNLHGDFWYQVFYGDKDTLRLCLRRLGQMFSVVSSPCTWPNDRIIYQRGPDGRVLFQHRCGYKWGFRQPNETPPGFVEQGRCQLYLDELGTMWDGKVRPPDQAGMPDEN